MIVNEIFPSCYEQPDHQDAMGLPHPSLMTSDDVQVLRQEAKDQIDNATEVANTFRTESISHQVVGDSLLPRNLTAICTLRWLRQANDCHRMCHPY